MDLPQAWELVAQTGKSGGQFKTYRLVQIRPWPAWSSQSRADGYLQFGVLEVASKTGPNGARNRVCCSWKPQLWRNFNAPRPTGSILVGRKSVHAAGQWSVTWTVCGWQHWGRILRLACKYGHGLPCACLLCITHAQVHASRCWLKGRNATGIGAVQAADNVGIVCDKESRVAGMCQGQAS